MIIGPRTIDITTRDVAPMVSDGVLLYGAGKGEPHRSRVTRVLAHLPALGPLGAWEVEIVGISKPVRTALVVQAQAGDAVTVGLWREIGGR